MKKILIYLLILLDANVCYSQTVGIGNWTDYLAYSSGLSVAYGNSKAYCATKSGLFSYDPSDNSLEHFSTVNGFSDVEARVLGFNSNNNKLFISYDNSNIDILADGTIYNLGDIKRKSIIGNKAVNNVHFIDQFAYLACGFGIVVVDMDKYEVKDTYYIGSSGTPINVRDITSDSNYLYAATDSGLFKALVTSPNLANYTSWSTVLELPSGIYNTIASINGKLITNFSSFLKNGSKGKDTLFVSENGSWNYFGNKTDAVNSIEIAGNQMVITFDGSVSIYDQNLDLVRVVSDYFGAGVQAKKAILSDKDNLWIADTQFGLVSGNNSGNFQYFFPNGPNSQNVSAISIEDNMLWVAPGGGGGNFLNDGIYNFDGEGWKHIYGNHPPVVNFDSVNNITNVLIDPNNTQRVFATWFDGVIEFNGNVPVKLYDDNNSTLKPLTIPGYNPISVYGLAFDAAGNLWVGNSGVPSCLSSKSPEGVWKALDFSSFLGNTPALKQLLIDMSDQKWFIKDLDGIVVYNGGTDAPTSLNTKKLNMAVGSGSLPSSNVYCLAEDNEGQIWVGTDQGIAVFYNPASMFAEQNFDAQQILLEQDGNIQLLLETETIQSIAIDGANRKWIATSTSGVFLMSADGTKEVFHFTEKNSPLFSDNVKTIAINQESGEVFFGTSKGIISFRGSATGAMDIFKDVYSFPNPVKPEYSGPIAIKGLMENTTVKITDISGTIVYEAISEGGQAIWNGKTFSGDRVSSGVYMVFCTSEDGAEKVATKILFIN